MRAGLTAVAIAAVLVAVSGAQAAAGGLTIKKVADAATVSAGDQIGYVISVANTANGPANNVQLTDTLPANPGTSWSMSPAVPGCTITSGILKCTASQVPGNFSGSIHIVSPTTGATCGTVSNTASIKSTNRGSATSGVATITVNCPTLNVMKTADAAEVTAGQQVGFKIVASNAGPGNAYGVTMKDQLPTGPTWAIDTANSDPSCHFGTGTPQILNCTAATLVPGASIAAHVVATSSAGDCPSITNSSAKAVSTNGGLAFQSGPVSIAVDCPPDLIVSAISIQNGDPQTYTATIKNVGTGTAVLNNVTVQGHYSADQVLDNTDNPAGGTTINGTLAPGNTIVVQLGSGSPPAATDNYLLVDVDFTNAVKESDETNNLTSVPIPRPDLIVSNIVFQNGDPQTYTATIKNVGTGTAVLNNVAVQGYYSANAVFDPTDDPAGGSTINGNLAPGGTVDVALASGSPPAAGDNYLVVTVDLPNDLAESNETNNESSAPLPNVDLVVKSISFVAPTGSPPDSYTVTVQNIGGTTADLSGVGVQGYYSITAGTWSGDPACGNSFPAGTTVAPGASAELVVGCSFQAHAGELYLVVKVNDPSVLFETDTTNNIGSVPLYSADLSDNGACLFTLNVTWHNSPIDTLIGQWSVDGSFLLTTVTPMSGGSGSVQTGPFVPTPDLHTWDVRAQFYGGGAQYAEIFSNPDTIPCGVVP